jgi:RNA polymerase sigma-70 factor (ECF subfamily)
MEQIELRSQLQTLHSESFGWALCCCARNAEQAADVLQAVYLKVLDGKAVFDGRSAFKTWLFAVIRRTAADERRREIFRRLGLTRLEPRLLEQHSPDVAATLSENRRAFVAALAALPRRQREVLHLVFYQDLSLSEAATVMHVSVGSARKHYDRAKQAIRQRLSEQFDAGSPTQSTRRTVRRETPGVVL